MSYLDSVMNIQPDVQDNEERAALGKTSIAKVVLIFYLFAMQDYCNNLIGKPLKRFIEDNRIFQHFIGFLVIFVLLSWESDLFGTGPALSVRDALIYSIIGYTWVIFSSKLDAHWNIILLGVLVAVFVLDNHFRRTENEARDDPNLTDKQRMEIIKANNLYRTWLTASAILVTIAGTLLYSDRKSEQYGGSYDVLTYLLY
jgi:hypothetical protein